MKMVAVTGCLGTRRLPVNFLPDDPVCHRLTHFGHGSRRPGTFSPMEALTVLPANLLGAGFPGRGLRGWVAVLPSLLLAQAAGAAERQHLHGHVPAAVARRALRDRPEAARRLNLAIGLPLRNQAALTTLLQGRYDPASPS